MSVASGSEEAIGYARSHLGEAGPVPADPHLKITLDWEWGGRRRAAPAGEGAERVGKEMTERGGRLAWGRVPGFEGLRLEAGREGEALDLRASCGYTPKDAFARVRYMRAGRRRKKSHRTFFKLMYYAIYYPLVWHFARTRGWGLLHASAVERDGRAVILSGFGGVGKSTLALSLLADPSFRFISDNLILHDAESVYALPEPVRLDHSSLTAISAQGYAPARSDLPPDAHPKPTYRVEPARTADSARAAVAILLRFTPRPLIRPLGPAEALAHLTASRDLVKEVEGCRAVSAFLSMACAEDAEAAAEPAGLAPLCGRLQVYLLGIGEGEAVATTLARIRELCG